MANQLALAAMHIWTTTTWRITTIESDLATVTHTCGSPLLEWKNVSTFMENVSALDIVLRYSRGKIYQLPPLF